MNRALIMIMLLYLLPVHVYALDTSDNKAAVEWFEKGETAHNDGANTWGEAIVFFTKAIDLKPNYSEAYYERAWVYYERGESTIQERGDFQQAIKDFSKVIELKPDYYEAYCDRADVYVRLDDFKRAEEDYNKAIHLNPERGQAYYGRGKLYDESNQPEQAAADMKKAASLGYDAAHTWLVEKRLIGETSTKELLQARAGERPSKETVCSYIMDDAWLKSLIDVPNDNVTLQGYCDLDQKMAQMYGSLTLERLESSLYSRRTYSYSPACFATARLLRSMTASELRRFLLILSQPSRQGGSIPADAGFLLSEFMTNSNINPIDVLRVELVINAKKGPNLNKRHYANLFPALFTGDDVAALKEVRSLNPKTGNPKSKGWSMFCGEGGE